MTVRIKIELSLPTERYAVQKFRELEVRYLIKDIQAVYLEYILRSEI
jgi:hypothetical protein